MSFKQAYTSLLVTIACCTVLSVATPLSYLRDNDQNGFPFGNQGSFTYLRDNDQVQAVYPVQSGPVNYINNIGSSQVQTVGSYPGVVSNVGVSNGVGIVGTNGVVSNGYSSNIINTVNSVNGYNGLTTIQSPFVSQVPFVSYPSVQQVVPVAQYAVPQPSYIGGPVGYSNNNQQVTNNQVVPVEINYRQ